MLRLSFAVLLLLAASAAAQTCRECEKGTFCFENNLYSCPRDSTSRVSADNVTACICTDGFRQVSVHNHSCVLCEAGTYCVAERQLPCPERSDSGRGSANLAACVCDTGYAGAPGDNVSCVACAHAKFEVNHECVGCHDNSFSALASSTATACVCNAGYTGNDGQACSACAEGKFKSSRGSAPCAGCAQHSHVIEVGSVSADVCKCQTGFTRHDGVCRRCPLGTFKTTLSDDACTSCPPHSNTTDTGSTVFAACLCLPGFGFNGTHCSQCVPGHASAGGAADCLGCASGSHAPNAGSSVCVACGADSWQSAQGQAECVACPVQAKSPAGSTAQNDCRCDPGYSGQLVCAACMPGTFKAESGPAACDPCGIGDTTIAAATITATNCTACPAGTYGLIADDAAKCAGCPENTTLVRGDGDPGLCACSPGYGGDDCAACIPGSHKETLGPGACDACDNGFVSTEAQATCAKCASNTFETGRVACVPCPVHAHAAEGTHAACTCDAGYPLFDGNCTACAPGQYESIEGHCVPCPADTFRVEAAAASQAACLACHDNSSSPAGSTRALACRCLAGFSGEGACTACAEGTYKDITGSAECTECAPGTHWPQHKRLRDQNLCAACPGNSTSGPAAHGVYNCHCLAGFRRVDDECMQCLRGQHCAGGLSPVQTCPSTSTSAAGSAAVTDCVCVPGHYGANGTCAICPVNSYCEGGRFTTACPSHSTTLTLPGSPSRAACKCGGGYYEFAGDCIRCPLDSYCYQDQRFRCGPNASSVPGSKNRTECFCDAGFVSTAGVCTACASDERCSGAIIEYNAVRLSLKLREPIPVTSDIRRRLLSDSWSDEGNLKAVLADALNVTFDQVYILDSKSTAGTLAVDVLVVTKTVAHARAMTAAFADVSFLPRLVNKSFVVSTARAVVLKIENMANIDKSQVTSLSISNVTVADILGNVEGLTATISVAAPVSCAVNASVIGGVCTCIPGAFCNENEAGGCTSQCVSCAEGWHCKLNVATPCPGNETAPALSQQATDCHCLSGYYRDNSSNCVQCPLHSYCVEEQRHQCPLFDSNLVTEGPGQTERTACHCKPGLFRLTQDDRCRPCPLNYYCPSEYEVYACMQYGYTETTASRFKSNCLCHGGYQWGASDDTCMACEDNVCGGGNVTAFCDASRMPDLAHTACVCRPGKYPLNLRECRSCPAGHVRAGRGDEPCTPCAIGTFSANTTHCVSCAENMNTSGSGQAHCLCNAPLVFVGGRCEPCPVDSKFELFDVASNSTRVGGSVVHSYDHSTNSAETVTQQWHRGFCKRCPASASTLGEQGLTAPAVCVCDRGFHILPATGECEACPENFFESGGVCKSCGLGAVSPNTSKSENDCVCPEVVCTHGTRHPPKLFGRHCLLACDPVLHVCENCKAGTAKSNVSTRGNTDTCVSCVFGKFEESTSSIACDTCTPTRTHMLVAATNRSQCLCRPGHAPDPAAPSHNAPCLQCEPGYYKPGLSNAPCQVCDFGEFAPDHGSTVCLSCADHAPTANATTTKQQASRNYSECTCFPGHEKIGDACVACPTGSYRATKGTETCAQCGATQLPHHYGSEQVSTDLFAHCATCPLHAGQNSSSVSRDTPMVAQTDCLCFPHFELHGSACAPCPDFHVKLGFGPGPCELCPAGSHVDDVNGLECVECDLSTANAQVYDVRQHQRMAVNSENETLLWAETQTDCVCHRGYERKQEECHACPPGEFRGARLPTACEPCANGTYSDTAASLSCTECPPLAHTNNSGKDSIDDCMCPAGFAWAETAECIICPLGTIRPDLHWHSQCEDCTSGYYQDEEGRTQCKTCGVNEWSHSASESLESCRCNPGFGLDATGECAACAHGSYSAGGSEIESRPPCTLCPLNKNTSETHATRIEACMCTPGHGVAEPDDHSSSQSCVACTTGYYSGGGDNTPCRHCGFGGITDPPLAASSFEACQCNAVAGLYSSV